LEGKFELFYRTHHGNKLRINQSEKHPTQQGKGPDFESPPGSIHRPILVEDEEAQPQKESVPPRKEASRKMKQEEGSLFGPVKGAMKWTPGTQ
jgi:hypothetical protein